MCHRYGTEWATKFHSSHDLMVARPLVYCCKCGRWAGGEHILRLAAPCTGPLTSKDPGGYRARMRDIERGVHPLTGALLDSLPLPLLRGQQ